MDRVSHKIALLGLAVLPLCAVPGMMFRDSWEAACVYGACTAFAFYLKPWWFRIFMLCAVVSLAMHPTVASCYGIAMIAIFLGAGNLFLGMSSSLIMSMMRICGLSMAGVVGLQLMDIVPKYSGSATGVFNPNACGVFFALCMPAFFSGIYRYFIPVFFGCIVLSESTTGFISLAAQIAVFVTISYRRVGKVAVFGFAAVCAIWCVWIDPVSLLMKNERWMAWKHVVLTFRSEMFGRGIGSFKETFNYFILSDPNIAHNWTCAHNEYLQAGYEMGVQAVLVIVAFLAVYAVRTWRYRRRMSGEQAQIAAGVAAVAVSCAGWFTFHVAPLALVSMAWIAMWIGGFDRISPETEVI